MKQQILKWSSLFCVLGLALPVQAAGDGKLGQALGKDGVLAQAGNAANAATAAAGAAAGSLVMPDLSGSASALGGNVAGVLTYCVKNNYLKKAANADSVKDALLERAGFGAQKPAEQDPAFTSGAAGMLTGKDGKSIDLSQIQDNVKEQACDYVLDKAPSLM